MKWKESYVIRNIGALLNASTSSKRVGEHFTGKQLIHAAFEMDWLWIELNSAKSEIGMLFKSSCNTRRGCHCVSVEGLYSMPSSNVSVCAINYA